MYYRILFVKNELIKVSKRGLIMVFLQHTIQTLNVISIHNDTLRFNITQPEKSESKKDMWAYFIITISDFKDARNVHKYLYYAQKLD